MSDHQARGRRNRRSSIRPNDTLRPRTDSIDREAATSTIALYAPAGTTGRRTEHDDDRRFERQGFGIDTDLSIVIPAYNEQGRIDATLRGLRAELDSTIGPDWEIVVSDDGSTDETAAIVQRHLDEDPRIRFVGSPANAGKGAAIVRGFRASSSTWVLLMDADLPVPVSSIAGFLDAGVDVDLVTGSRRLPTSTITTPQPPLRKAGGRAFLTCVAALGFGGFGDPQCGVKLLRRSATAPVIDEAILTRFAFDVELLTRARRRGLRIIEHPVSWTHVPGSTLHPIRDAAVALSDLVRLRRRLRTVPVPTA